MVFRRERDELADRIRSKDKEKTRNVVELKRPDNKDKEAFTVDVSSLLSAISYPFIIICWAEKLGSFAKFTPFSTNSEVYTLWKVSVLEMETIIMKIKGFRSCERKVDVSIWPRGKTTNWSSWRPKSWTMRLFSLMRSQFSSLNCCGKTHASWLGKSSWSSRNASLKVYRHCLQIIDSL